jgi:hypothetical protein
MRNSKSIQSDPKSKALLNEATDALLTSEAQIARVSSSPLSLAALYKSGLGTMWSNQIDAARKLSGPKSTITPQVISHALATASLPAEILNLFSTAGIVQRTARALATEVKRQGVEALVARAVAAEGSLKDQGRRRILLYLQGAETNLSRRPGVARDPAEVAKCFYAGVASKKWKTRGQAEKILGWGAQSVYIACRIMELPYEVRALFPGRALSQARGSALLRIQRSVGFVSMRDRASELQRQNTRLTPNEILTYLASAPLASEPVIDDSIKLKIRSGRDGSVVFEFRCLNDDFLIKNKPKIEAYLTCALNSL